MKTKKLIDFFIHSDYFLDPGRLRKVRLFIRACLLTSLFSNSYVWLSMFFEFDKGVYLMIFNAVGFLILPFLAKTRLPINLLGNTYVAIGAVAIFSLTYYSGGVWSAIYPWIIAIPVLALLVVSKRSGGIWGGISFIAMVWFGILALRGIELPIEYNPELKTLWFVSVVPGLLLIILLISFVFEFTQSTALSNLEKSNELLLSQKDTIAKQSVELKEVIDDKEYIIRVLAHDLKNPLMNIAMLTNLLITDNDSSRHSTYVELMSKSTRHSQDLIKKVLEMDSMDQKDLKIQFEESNIIELISEVIDMLKNSAESKNITIKLSYKSADIRINSDAIFIKLILENLIANAIKFSDSNKLIAVEAVISGSNVRIAVIDEGPGVPANEVDKLFKKFSKLSAKPTGGESSSGLGLSLVKRYADILGGNVWYESNSSDGASFIIELPLNT
jgi:signal transduction histidine kinase